jgi:GIY-YIG catalytic domain
VEHTQGRISIYVLTDPDSGEVRYVGQTANPKRRLYAHMVWGNGSQKMKRWLEDLEQRKTKPKMMILQTWPTPPSPQEKATLPICIILALRRS